MYDLNMIGKGGDESQFGNIEPYAIIYAAIGDGGNVIHVR